MDILKCCLGYNARLFNSTYTAAPLATIRVSEESMARWEANRRPGETVEEMINRVLDDVEDERSAGQYILDAKEARKELAEGRCVPHEQVRRMCGSR